MGWMPQPKDKDWLNGYKNKTPLYAAYKRPTSKQGTHTDWKWRGTKRYFGGLWNHCIWWLQPWNFERSLLLGRKFMINLDSLLKSRDITLPTEVHLVKALVFFSSHVWMWDLDYKESWMSKNWCFWTVVLEKTL